MTMLPTLHKKNHAHLIVNQSYHVFTQSTAHEAFFDKNIREWFEKFLLRKADREDVYITLIVIDHNILEKVPFYW